MRKIHLLFILSIFLVATQNAVAQKKYAPTFLWKISGNGLKTPSYMYGTMHLQDKELFNLGDSIYIALESVEGFSMEVDPNELMSALLKTLKDKDESPLVKDLITENKFKKIEKNIEEKYGISANKLTIKKLKKYIQNKVYKKKEGQMKTFMDMYLYNIAKKQNKKFAPVEDVADQLSLMDNFNTNAIEKYLETDSVNEEKYIEDFKKIYVNKDLTTLAKMVGDGSDDIYGNLALVKRNIKMARRIDSLTKIRTSFIAIGAAHLPGDSGLIKLLRDKGFTIEPVLSTKNIKPEEYKYKTAEKDWITTSDEDSLVTLQMPLQPSDKATKQDMNFKMAMDLSDYSLYGFVAVKSAEGNTDIPSVSKKMMEYYKKTGFEILNNKQIIQNEAKGIEFTGRENNEYTYRLKVLFKDKTMVILICGAQNKKYLYDDNFEKFFNSLKFTENVKPKEWKEFRNEESYYSIQVPKIPKKSKALEDTDASIIQTYTTTDPIDGATYLMQTTIPKPGYYFDSDSVYFNNYKNALNEQTKNGLQYFSPALLNNKPAMHFATTMKTEGIDIVLQGYIIRRANVFQILITVTTKETADYPNVSNFFNSYKELPFKNTKFTTQEISKIGITLQAPNAFVLREKDSTNKNGKEEGFYAYDSSTATTFYADADTISKYNWYKNDSTFYRNFCNDYANYTDSVINFTYDTLKYNANLLVKNKNADLYKKIHFTVNGNKIYTLYAYLPTEIINSDAEQKYFSAYKFSNVKKPTVFENNISLLVDSLNSKDSATAQNAFTALDANKYVSTDLPYLYKALLNTYSGTNKEQIEDNTRSIATKIKSIADTSTITFIKNNYSNCVLSDNIKVNMIEILADLKTEKSYSLLKNILLNTGLKSCNDFGFSYAMLDTPQLSKTLFPEITSIYQDTLLGGAIIQLANRLLDSNIIDKTVALQNQNGILQNATHQIKVLKRDKAGTGPQSIDIIQMLGKINNKQANDLLLQYLAIGETWDKEPALVQLIKNNATVAPASIVKIAADNYNRTIFYDDLKKIGKEKYYPALYYSQKQFAEGYLFLVLTEEYEQEEPKITFLSEKISKVIGVEKRFYLFKVKTNYDGETYYNLAIMGGFDKNLQKIALTYDEQQYYYEEEKYNAANVLKIYEKFIKDLNQPKTR